MRKKQNSYPTLTREQLETCVDRVICEAPYVRLLTAPTWYEEEVLPGAVKGEWRALAQVDTTLCVVVVAITEHAEDLP